MSCEGLGRHIVRWISVFPAAESMAYMEPRKARLRSTMSVAVSHETAGSTVDDDAGCTAKQERKNRRKRQGEMEKNSQ